MKKNYWLFKTDPEDFSIDDLKKSPEQTTGWGGVRNYQARNYLRDSIKKGDEVLFYHSGENPPSIRGVCSVTKEGYADTTQFDPEDSHFFPSATSENPVWFQVDIKLKQEFSNPVTLEQLKANKKLKDMMLLKRGNRLSVMPVAEEEFSEIIRIAGK
jgi:predicted RNA-binding protein with PUA-like domain